VLIDVVHIMKDARRNRKADLAKNRDGKLVRVGSVLQFVGKKARKSRQQLRQPRRKTPRRLLGSDYTGGDECT
jgi:hypothetical protein